MTKFVTFYTANTAYEEEAMKSVEAFRKFGIYLHAYPYVNQNDWMKNALARAGMLFNIASEWPGPICMTDADNRPVKYPEKLVNFSADFGCEFRGSDHPTNTRYSAGVMCFGDTALGREILADWLGNCVRDESPDTPLREQHYLCKSVESFRANPFFNFENLGNEYNRKPEQVKEGDDTVMIHYVASRYYLKQIGGKR